MNNYIDKYGFYHDAPVGSDGLPSSDNAYFYQAMAQKLGLIPWLTSQQHEIMTKTYLNKTRLIVSHRPQIPLSRDEVLAYEFFNFHFDGWNFSPEPIPKFSLWLTLVQFFHLVDPHTGKQKHMTTFWKQYFSQIYRFAYSIPLSDRHTVLRFRGKYNIFWHLVHIFSHLKKETRASQRQLAWFRTGKDIQAVANYFPKDHPFQEYVNGK